MIKNVRNVSNMIFRNAFGNPQGKIIILTSFKAGVEAADVPQDRCSINSEMGNKIHRIKKVWVPISLEIRIVPLASLIDLVFVAIQQIRFGILVELLRYQVQRLLGQFII